MRRTAGAHGVEREAARNRRSGGQGPDVREAAAGSGGHDRDVRIGVQLDRQALGHEAVGRGETEGYSERGDGERGRRHAARGRGE